MISKFWQSLIHIIIFCCSLSSLTAPVLAYRVSGSADGDFAVIWCKYYVAGSFGLQQRVNDDSVSSGQFRTVATWFVTGSELLLVCGYVQR